MKNVTKVLFSLMILVSCNYQVDPLLISDKSQTAINAEDHVITNDNTIAQNMNLLLDKYVVRVDCTISNTSTCDEYDTLVDYDTLYDERDDEALELRLNLYKQIKNVDTSILSKDDLTALYLNAYNFFAIETVLSNLFDASGSRLKSISDILGEGSFAAFTQINYFIAGEAVNLDSLEKVLLKNNITNSDGTLDARYHFAAICAAKGCPILATEAYEGDKIDSQLTDITIKGLSLVRNYEFVEGKTRLTSLFNWYSDDFKNHLLSNGQPASTFKAFIQEFIPSANVTENVEYIDYNWELNSL